MGDTTQTIINVTASNIESGAFAELLSSIETGTSLIINISGTVTLQPNAFSQLVGTTITSAEINISAEAIVTLGADAFANLPVKSLVLSASTTLEANALRDLPDLRVLNLSAVTTPMKENSLNLLRANTQPLVILMPTTNLTYEAGSISFPPTDTTSTTTVVFNGGNVPATAFAKPDPAKSSAAINVSINPDSNTTQLEANIADIITQLTFVGGNNALAPTTVTYSQVQNVIADINESIAPSQESLISVNQFNGDYFDNCIIAAKVPGAKAIKQCAVIGLTADAIKNDVKNISIPSVIIKNTISHNVINLASRMTLANHDQPFYIIDNYHDPSDTDLANIDVPLVAVFSRANANAAAGGFKPALVCNGIISNKNGAITVSGSRGVAGAHCRGHTETGSNTATNLIANPTTGSILNLHDHNATATTPPIARITFPSNDTFIVQFNPTEVMGCFEEYAPTTANASMVVDFTNVASASGAASNSFSVDVASLIANNNALVALLNQIKNSHNPTSNTFPETTVSISNELTALSKSDFHSVVSAWRILYNKHKVNYAPHLVSIKNFVDEVITSTAGNPAFVSANNQFKAWQLLLTAAIALVNNKFTGDNADDSPFYAATVLPYFGTRFSIGMQAFKKCQLLDHVVNFNLLRNISKINDDTFNSCTVLKSPANIPINVSSIGLRAYQNCFEIPSIDIQDAFALRTICESAFESCQQMEGNLAFSSSLGFTESVETIGDKAFRGCTRLTDHLYFPPTLKSIGVSAFDGCIGLNGTIVFPRNASFTFIPERAFAQCSGITGISTNTGNGTSLEYMGGLNGSGPIPNGLIIPAQVTSIGKEAFLNCSKLALELNLQQTPNPAQTLPRLPLNIQSIGNAAFSGCAAFTSLVLPSSVTYTVVAEDCFKGCTGIKELTIPSNVITILDGAFSGCNKIANVPKFDNIISIGNEAFNECAGMLGPLVLGTNLNILGDRAFFGCKFLTSATFLGPPPLGVSSSNLIFGLANNNQSPTTFHVNVFTENAWDETWMTVANQFKINNVFRAKAVDKSLVHMAFIAFNTYVPSTTSRNLTISNFKTFNVYSNTGDAGANAVVPAPTGGVSWNDVYIPGTLMGTDVINAKSNNNQVATLQSQVASLITPKIDAVQTRTIELLFSEEEALREFDGRNMAIATDLNGAPFQLEVITTASAVIPNNAVYGVFTLNGKDYLYRANDDNPSTLVTSTNNTNVSFFVKAADSVPEGGFKTKYANKLISIGHDGEIFVSNVLPIGYGATDGATAVAHSTTVPTTQTGTYTIFKSANLSVKDKLYFKAIIAPAGAYFISKVVGDPDLVYDSTVIYVGQDGSIDVPVRQLKNNFEIIASVAAVQGEGYSFVTDPQFGANTAYKFMKGANAAPPGYYLIQSSAVAKFNNAMIHVLPNGGVSTASFGALGSINKLNDYATAIASEPIPLYNDNPVVANFNHYMEAILPLNHNNHNDIITDFKAKLASFNSIHDILNKQILTSAMKTAISTVEENGAFVNSVGSLDEAVVAASGVINNATAALDTYNDIVDALNADISGSGLKSLKSIQTNTMNKITDFQRSCTFNSDPNATANDITYITSQINAFIIAILSKQTEQNASETAFMESIITPVKDMVFVVSPTKVSPAPSKSYASLSIQQKILFDFTVSFISQWLKNNNWSVVNTMESNGTQLLAWATDNILSTFIGPANQNIYQQFLTNQMVPSLANVRTSVSAYETALGGANPGTANDAAQLAYQAAVKVNDVTANFVAEAAAEAAPTDLMNYGKIRLNNAALNLVNKIFISLNDGAATPVPVSFKKFADTIVLNDVKYTITSVKTDAFCHTLDVKHVSGTAAIATNAAVSFYTYQAVSPYTFVQLDAMNADVWAQYFQVYPQGNDIASTTGIKPRIGSLKAALMSSVQEVAAKLSSVASSVADLQLKINTVNAAENTLTAKLLSLSGTGTAALDLAGAQMLARELDLFNAALADQITNTPLPSVATLPAYESSWFNQRVSAFWDDSEKVNTNLKPSVANRTTQYNAVNATFKAARYARQSAAIDLHIASTPPALGMTSPIPTQFASDQARVIMQTMPAYITSNKDDLAKLISTKLYNYVKDRDTYVGTDQNSKATKRNEYQQKKIDEFTKIMSENNHSYGKAAHNRYLSVIDLAISTAFYATVNVGQTNAFNTLMQQWNSASNKRGIFEQNIKSLLFDLVYTTNNTVYSTNDFPLKVATEYIAWFGAALSPLVDVKRNGFLYKIIKDGWQFVKDAYNTTQLGGIPLTAYAVFDGNTELTQPSAGLAQSLPAPTIQDFSTDLAQALVAERAKLTAAIAPLSSLAYSVVGIGYSSLANAEATDKSVASLGFTDITGGQTGLNFTITTANNNSLYKFTHENKWYHGYQQSSNLINSWLKLSPTQNAVMFYAGNDENTPATNLFQGSQSSLTALCDDVKYVMIIEAVAGSTTKWVSLYTYDVMGVGSGDLVAVGKLVGTVPTIYSVIGAFQKDVSNLNLNINLIGDLIIPSSIKTIGMNAFAKSSQFKSLVFGDDGTSGSVSIGSNAFQDCTALSAINLGQTIGSIGPSAFLNCSKANSLVLPPSPSNFSVINHWAFLGCIMLGKNGNLVLPTSLQQINVQAFARCPLLKCSQFNGLSNSYIPQSLQKIGTGAFLGCTGLAGTLDFNNLNNNGSYTSSIEFIGGAAFMGCTGLNGSLALPINPKYTNVLPYVFSSMDAPINAISGQPIPTPSAAPMALIGAIDVSSTKITTIETRAFYKCSALSSITLSNLVSKIGVQSFWNCSSLGGVLNVPASVLNVGEEAFMGCSTLSGLNIVSATVSSDNAGSGTTLGPKCFKRCTSLVGSTATSGLVIPNNVIRMEDNAFEGCASIEALTVGSGFTKAGSFGANLFSGCTKLARVVLAFSFLSRDVAGQSVVKNATVPQTNPPTPYNSSFTGCTALGVVPDLATTGTVQIQSGATGWTAGRAAFFNQLTIVINNKNITFYLKEFNKNISVVDPSKDAVQLEALPVADAQAVVYVKASDMRKVFQVSTDSYVIDQDTTSDDNGRLFFVRPDMFPQYLNVANAHVVQGGIESYNSKPYEQLVKDDVMRYYATSLFNSADWVTLFSNDVEMMENMVASSGLMPIVPNGETASGKNLINEGVLNKIMTELNKIAYTKPDDADPKLVQSRYRPSTSAPFWWALPDTITPEQGNIGMKLFNLISRNDPGRIASVVLNGSTPSELPFLPGDQFIFVFTLNDNEVQLSPELPKVTVKKRTYMIKLALTDDFNSGSSSFADHTVALYSPSPINLNVLPVSGAYAADYMYSNYDLYVAAKPSLLNQTESSVYSRITKNMHEPVPMPPLLLPFTGWYYNYENSTQSIKLDFTPPDNSVVNYSYSDLRYLSAYIYFPTAWSSQTALPNPNNFPQWVVTFVSLTNTIILYYKATFLNTQGADTVNFLGQTVPFDYTNTHVQLICPFDNMPTELSALLAGKLANGDSGTLAVIAGTDIYRQRHATDTVSGLRKPTSNMGPFTYPPIARGYQGINMKQPQNLAALKAPNSEYRLGSIALDINMTNNDGFVPSVIVKSVEVVAKKYEAYYLAPLDPN